MPEKELSVKELLILYEYEEKERKRQVPLLYVWRVVLVQSKKVQMQGQKLIQVLVKVKASVKVIHP